MLKNRRPGGAPTPRANAAPLEAVRCPWNEDDDSTARSESHEIDERMLTVTEAAEEAGTDARLMAGLVGTGRIPGIRVINGRPMVPKSALAPLAKAKPPPEPWPDPIPLTSRSDPPPFPVEALPSWLRAWVEAEAHATQTPPDMAGMLALAVVATCCARRIEVHVRDGWREPACIYTAVALPPGNRKSAVFRDATAPLEAMERERVDALAPEIARARAGHRVAEQALRAAENRAAKATGDEQIAAIGDVRDAADDIRKAADAIPTAPRYVTGDTTPEALARLLGEQSGRMAVMDAEGCGPIAIMLGRYSTGSASVDVYLRGHAGDPIRVDRRSAEPLVVHAPALTMALTVQPEVLRQLGERREMRGLGLLARILWCVPESTIGRRLVRPEPMPQHVRDAYDARVRRLLELEGDDEGHPRPVRLSEAADDVLADLQERLEPRIGPGGDLEHMSDWTGKLPGAVARLAGLLHMAEHGGDGVHVDVSPHTMQAAVQLGDYLLVHARAALESMGADPVLDDAQHVLDWLRAHGVERISQRNLWDGAMRARCPRAEDIQPVIDALVERGWLRYQKQAAKRGPGRKPSPKLDVNPALFTRPHNTQNPQNGGR